MWDYQPRQSPFLYAITVSGLPSHVWNLQLTNFSICNDVLAMLAAYPQENNLVDIVVISVIH